jgi:triosephosphate isomerase
MKFILAANWKMNKGPAEATAFFKEFTQKFAVLKDSSLKAEIESSLREVIFFVPSVDLWVAQMTLRESAFKWGAQNCYFEMEGAFTGETSPLVLAQMGVPYVLLGHSERRTLFHETDQDIAKKLKAAHQVQLTPMLCVGETLEQRQAGETAGVITNQLRLNLAGRNPALPLVVAYEPIWAIGTGQVATAQQANEAHQILRSELRQLGGSPLAEQTPILYGGSVKPENATELASQPEINGFLVGGASLKVDSFLALVQAAN